MFRSTLLPTTVLFGLTLAGVAPGRAQDSTTKTTTTVKTDKPAAGAERLTPEEVGSDGAVDAGGQHIAYRAVAGTIVVHPKGWDDAAKPGETGGGDKADENPSAESAMFFTAYFRKGVTPGTRPITFLYNGGPGSASVWLHMGSFGPRRVELPDHAHGATSPFRLVNNAETLLDVTDLVFVDAPGTGFSRVVGKDKDKAFFGVDQDAQAFSRFIETFLSKYGRWDSPRYLFGESYGTTRSAVVVNELQQEENIDVNGVILLSSVLNFDYGVDAPETNPGIDVPYVGALPTYAATALYQHKLGSDVPQDTAGLVAEVTRFADTDYAAALLAGAALDPDRKRQVAQTMSRYTGLPVDYLVKANLRVNGMMFEHELLGGANATTGRFDTRYVGPTMDPLAKQAEYDPQSAAISSAYVSAFNDYARRVLGYGGTTTYKPGIQVEDWDNKHQQPGQPADQNGGGPVNVLPDLAAALVYDPNLHVLLNQGYYDLATPFHAGELEMRHLPMPDALQNRISIKRYEAGHMVYVNPDARRQLHDNVATFIRDTENVQGGEQKVAPPPAH